ncbi:uncharacterized protein B0I36DRAFT_157984 [Microdochium trichocladiopsis]|uniref:Uncharacterized protein n=1 Tax=Microdochium trichocladiopsis TaxID=1682393 RepID=A0A9P9BML3_9PEZI|nr:uncharacterized protein B0I36DRAFT_157984 [Microdochium trichocladiopsis]KAH7026395.1 hypothetical protein B0I36DRAFT_157984 [Microdochium trichocladiopsis]
MGIVVPPLRSRQSVGRPKSPPPRPPSLQSISETAMMEQYPNNGQAPSPLDTSSIGMALSAGSGWPKAAQEPLPLTRKQVNHQGFGPHQIGRPGVGQLIAVSGHRKSRSTGSIAAPSSRSTTMTRTTSNAEPVPTTIPASSLAGSTGRNVRPREMDSTNYPTHTQAPTDLLYQPQMSTNQGFPARSHGDKHEPNLTRNWQGMISKPSQKTVGSEGQWEDVDDDDDDDDGDDAWEDIRPPGSLKSGAWGNDGGDSNGSFLVYI